MTRGMRSEGWGMSKECRGHTWKSALMRNAACLILMPHASFPVIHTQTAAHQHSALGPHPSALSSERMPFRIGNLAGTTIDVDFSFLILCAFFSLREVETHNADRAFLIIPVILVSLLIHELAHAG